MANFKQHITFSALGCGIGLTPLLGANIITPPTAFMLWGSGTIGGILPDIDSDNSTALKLIFAIICMLVCGIMLTNLAGKLTTPEIWLCFAFIYGVVYVGIRQIFAQFTVHRGVFHSLLAACVISLITVSGAHHILNLSDTVAWLCGLFMFVGYTLHLLLDELYSVDLMNAEVKRSFGSALKPASVHHWQSSLAMALLLIPLLWVIPDHQKALWLLTSERTSKRIQASFSLNNWTTLGWMKQLGIQR